VPHDSLHIDEDGRTWSIRDLLASDLPRVRRRLCTASLWSRASHQRCWGSELPSPAYVLATSGLLQRDGVPDNTVIQYADTVEDHQLRIANLIRAIRLGDLIEPLVIGLDGWLWDGKHRLAALYACNVPEVDVFDFSDGQSMLIRPPVSLDEVIAPRLREAHASHIVRERFSKAEPYRHIFIPEVFDRRFAETVAHESEGLDWRLSTTDFYEQYEVSLIDTEKSYESTALDVLREIALSPQFADFISSITGQGQLFVADVACHRSTTGQQIGIHNDFYPEGEVCRFTIHLNADWTLDDGGLFITFASEDSASMTAAYVPAMNSALLFEISPASFHAVTDVTTSRPRYSIVISFLRREPASPVDEKLSHLADVRQRALPRLRPEVVDIHNLRRLRTRRCVPASCGGECCRDGAGLLPEEIPLLEHLAVEYTDELSSLGVSTAGLKKNGDSARTSLTTTEDGRTHCSWLMADGKCSLQVLGETHLQQPWIYKPLACILMPLRVRSHEGARVLTADRRVLNNSTAIEPCLSSDDNIPFLEGVEDEIEFIAEVWDIDVHEIMDVAGQLSSKQGPECANSIGIITTTEMHVLWAVESDHEHVEVLKIPRFESVANVASEERVALRKLAGRWFPTLSQSGCDPQGITRMSFVGGHIPLDLWLRNEPREAEIIDVARDLLRALIALEDLQMYHLDLAPRNVLVNLRERTVVIVDFEDAVDSGCQVECAGGAFGYAAPEQYLNYLGLHSRMTESFFVGAVIYQACIQHAQQEQRAFPFSNLERIPESLRGALAALVGDPLQFFAPHTRWSARDVLSQWMLGQSLEIPSKQPVVIPSKEPKQRYLKSPDGSTLIIKRKGLTLLHGETTIARWDGLVHVANTPAEWTEPLRIGPLIITSDGFMRSSRTD
jgi:Rps23 Pro-64 3,4-dihydroxylase Tpa1-like proline 4-hydroxylase